MAFLSVTQPRTRIAPRRTTLRGMLALIRQRRQLAQLDRNALDDIGISRDEAMKEARRPFWDAPRRWTR